MYFDLQGANGKALMTTDNIDDRTVAQIIQFLNEDFTKDIRIAVMPDVHAGKGSVVGTTMEVKDAVVPSLVGSDIGCGVMCMEVKIDGLNLEKLDAFIKANIPLGAANHEKPRKAIRQVNLEDLICLTYDESSLRKSMTTLGGGNHFIELGTHDGRYFLLIHTGSRFVGTVVSKFHQKNAVKIEKQRLLQLQIERIKANSPKDRWQQEIENLSGLTLHLNKDLTPLRGQAMDDYLHDLEIAQAFAYYNRLTIAETIVKGMGWQQVDLFDSVHNYVDLKHRILRKGAISARKGERIVVPINMRDGAIMAIGKGNEAWNQSAPHGAGRIYSRKEAKALFNVDRFKEQMKDVYSSTVGEGTLDESPDAYKPIDEILEKTKDTMDVQFIIKPIYNIKG